MATSPPPPATKTDKSQRNKGLMRRLALAGKQVYISVLGFDRYKRARTAYQVQQKTKQGMNLLLVHTMGKVGSTTIAASLKARGFKKSWAMYQPHFLSEEWLANADRLANAGIPGWATLARQFREGFPRSHRLSEELARQRKAGKQVTVITIVRDPVAVNISGLFHNQAWWPSELKAACAKPTADCLAELQTYFLESYPHDVPDVWFDNELRPLYNVDVFAEPFDKEKGYAIYRSELANILLLKLEDVEQCAAEAFKEFLGLDDFKLVTANTAENKEYADIYKAFRKNLSLPDTYLDRMYASRVAQHFYTDEEIAEFRRKWVGGKAG